MQRTFCDKCGTECVHQLTRLYGSIVHMTSNGEVVAEDSLKSIELCATCTGEVAKIVKFTIIDHGVSDGPDMMVSIGRPAPAVYIGPDSGSEADTVRRFIETYGITPKRFLELAEQSEEFGDE